MHFRWLNVYFENLIEKDDALPILEKNIFEISGCLGLKAIVHNWAFDDFWKKQIKDFNFLKRQMWCNGAEGL